jgi:hypothetical protein
MKELQNDEAFAPRVLRSGTITSTMKHSSSKRDLPSRIAESAPESWTPMFGMGLGVQLRGYTETVQQSIEIFEYALGTWNA